MFYLYETQQLQGMAESDDTLVFHPAAGRMQPEELEGAVGGSQQEENGEQPSSREQLNAGVQQLVADINAKRKRDLTLLDDFKKELDEQFSAAYTGVEASVFSTYEQVNQSIEDKLQELYAVLDRIAKHEEEIDAFKRALHVFNSDVQRGHV